MSKRCPVCQNIEQIRANNNPFFVKEMKSGYVVVCHHQFYRGYMLFMSKEHKKELHELDMAVRKTFLIEMSLVAEAIYRAFRPRKLNYELLGNTVAHLHWHLIPRYEEEINIRQPIWSVDSKIRCAEKYRPSIKELELIKQKMLSELYGKNYH